MFCIVSILELAGYIMKKIERELLKGAGLIAVMRLLETGEKYGYELVDELVERTGGYLAMNQSTLYPMLYNLEAKGHVVSRVDRSGSRPRRYYRLTDKGRTKLAGDLEQWNQLVQARHALQQPLGGTALEMGGVA